MEEIEKYVDEFIARVTPTLGPPPAGYRERILKKLKADLAAAQVLCVGLIVTECDCGECRSKARKSAAAEQATISRAAREPCMN